MLLKKSWQHRIKQPLELIQISSKGLLHKSFVWLGLEESSIVSLKRFLPPPPINLQMFSLGDIATIESNRIDIL